MCTKYYNAIAYLYIIFLPYTLYVILYIETIHDVAAQIKAAYPHVLIEASGV